LPQKFETRLWAEPQAVITPESVSIALFVHATNVRAQKHKQKKNVNSKEERSDHLDSSEAYEDEV